MSELWFQRPLWLLACLPLMWLWWFIAQRIRQSDDAWRGVVDAHLSAHVVIGRRSLGRRVPPLAALGLCWLAAVFALAGPVLGEPTVQREAAARIQVFLIEIPASLGLRDDVEDRWEHSRQAARVLLGSLPNRETAVVLYSRHPFLLIPPTTDRDSIDQLLQALRPGLLPEYDPRPDLALAMAKDMRGRNGNGAMDLYWLTAGDIASRSDGFSPGKERESVLYYGLDATLAAKLQSFAEGTGGGYAAPFGDIAPHSLDALIAPDVQTTAASEVAIRELGPALVLLVLPLAIFAFQPSLLSILLISVLSFGLVVPEPSFAGNEQDATMSAVGNWELGNRLLAAASFIDPCWRAVASYQLGRHFEAAALWVECPGADAAFNRGNALAKGGRLDEALAAYDKALRIRPDDDDFLFNRRIVQDLVMQQPPKPSNPPPVQKSSPSFEVSQMPPFSSAGGGSFDARKLSKNAVTGRSEVEQLFLQRLLQQRLAHSCKKQSNAKSDPKYC